GDLTGHYPGSVSLRMNPRGVSLVEVLVAATLTGMLALLAGGTVLRAGHELNRRAERFAAEQTPPAAGRSLRLLVESDAEGQDLLATGSSSLTARVVRGLGVLCDVDSGTLVVRRDQWE